MKKIIIIVTFAIAGITANAQYIKVNREVICPGEYAALSTDTMVNAVNIGDIICYNSAGDTIIVTASDWNYYSSIGYTALSVVFFVDSTGQHGWAVKAGQFATASWQTGRTKINTPLQDLNILRSSLFNCCGRSNSDTVKMQSSYTTTLYPAFANCQNPFYLPAIGQLNYLYSQQDIISNRLSNINSNYIFSATSSWWSSSENDKNNALILTSSGIIAAGAKGSNINLVLPTMDF